jgi:hypothetical protein
LWRGGREEEGGEEEEEEEDEDGEIAARGLGTDWFRGIVKVDLCLVFEGMWDVLLRKIGYYPWAVLCPGGGLFFLLGWSSVFP